MKFNVLLYLLGLVSKSSLSQICDPNDINCISCNEYQKCVENAPEGRKFTCKSGSDCSNNDLKLCQKKLNCYGLSECTELGIFSDSFDDSNFYVCMTDGDAGFLKYEFTCSEGYFFDPSGLVCVPRSLTSVAFNDSILSSTSVDPTSSTSTASFPTELPPFSCPSPGIFPHPTNCKMYYRCSTILKVFYYICPGNSYFNENILKCSMIITPSCQEQILKNLTSTTSTVESTFFTTTTPVSTPSPPSTITSTPSTQSTTTASTTSNPSTTTTSTPSPPSTITSTPSTQSTTTASTTSDPSTTTTSTPSPPSTITSTPSTQSTTTASTTSNPSTTTTSTPLPPSTTITSTTSTQSTTTTSTTTPTPLTTNPPLPTQFSCPGAGTFANPSDCKIYYKCSSSGKIFRYVCPGNSFFNELTNRCSLVLTPRCKNLISM